MKQMKKMGSLSKLMKFVPGMSQMMGEIDEAEMEAEMAHTEAIIQSMTLEERDNPTILNGSRRARIAKGCGLTVADINKLIKEFEMARKMMKEMMGGGGAAAMMGGRPGAGALGHGPGKGKGKSKKLKKKKKKKKSR